MNVRLLPCAPGEPWERQHLTCFLVGDRIAIDAGSLGLHSETLDAAAPTDVFLTHAHLDHVATLPLYLEDRHDRGAGPVRVHGPRAALDALRTHFFNECVWVEFSRMGTVGRPWVELLPLEPERPVRVNGTTITGVPVVHTVPACGYVVDDGVAAVAFGADSGPTDRLWEVARATGRLRAAFLECSFPDALEDLARGTGHLTPRLWALEAAKLPADAQVVAVHLKPRHREQVAAELRALGDPRLVIADPGREYAF